jgi:hypothetical protein
MVKFLKEVGFQKSRQHGSHIFSVILTGALLLFLFIKGKIWVGGLPARYFTMQISLGFFSCLGWKKIKAERLDWASPCLCSVTAAPRSSPPCWGWDFCSIFACGAIFSGGKNFFEKVFDTPAKIG